MRLLFLSLVFNFISNIVFVAQASEVSKKQKRNEKSPFSALPQELKSEFAAFLPLPDLLNFTRVSRSFNKVKIDKRRRDENWDRLFFKAKSTTDRVRKKHLQTEALAYIAKLEAQAGFKEDARETFQKAERIAREIIDLLMKPLTLAKIAIEEAEAHFIEEAKQILAQTEEVFLKAQIQAKIAQVQAQEDLLAEARASFVEAKEIISLAELSPEEKAENFSFIAVIQAENHFIEEAIETASEISDDLLKAKAFRKIAEAQALEADRACFENFRLANSFSRESYSIEKNRVLADIAVTEAQAGMIPVAKETREEITDKFYRVFTLANIAVAENREEESQEEAKASFALAKKEAFEITHNERDQLKAFVEIAKAEAQAGLKDEAKDTFELACIKAGELSSFKTCALEQIAAAAAQVGFVKRAREISESSSSSLFCKERTFVKIAKAEARLDLEKAKFLQTKTLL